MWSLDNKRHRALQLNHMKDFYKKYGSWALVTGGSSGIGEEFAKQLVAVDSYACFA